MKRFMSILIAFTLILSMTGISFAIENNRDSMEEKKRGLVNSLKDINDPEIIDIVIQEFLKENKSTNKNFRIRDIETLQIKNGKVINKNVDTFDIGANGKIFFMDNGLIHTIIPNEANNEVNDYSLRASSSRKVDETFTSYSWLGIKIFSVRLAGEFDYDGSKAVAYITQGSFKPAFLSLWDLGSWTTGERDSTSSRDAYIYAYGGADLNISIAEILGLELNFDHVDINATIYCNKNGDIIKSYSVD